MYVFVMLEYKPSTPAELIGILTTIIIAGSVSFIVLFNYGGTPFQSRNIDIIIGSLLFSIIFSLIIISTYYSYIKFLLGEINPKFIVYSTIFLCLSLFSLLVDYNKVCTNMGSHCVLVDTGGLLSFLSMISVSIGFLLIGPLYREVRLQLGEDDLTAKIFLILGLIFLGSIISNIVYHYINDNYQTLALFIIFGISMVTVNKKSSLANDHISNGITYLTDKLGRILQMVFSSRRTIFKSFTTGVFLGTAHFLYGSLLLNYTFVLYSLVFLIFTPIYIHKRKIVKDIRQYI